MVFRKPVSSGGPGDNVFRNVLAVVTTLSPLPEIPCTMPLCNACDAVYLLPVITASANTGDDSLILYTNKHHYGLHIWAHEE